MHSLVAKPSGDVTLNLPAAVPTMLDYCVGIKTESRLPEVDSDCLRGRGKKRAPAAFKTILRLKLFKFCDITVMETHKELLTV